MSGPLISFGLWVYVKLPNQPMCQCHLEPAEIYLVQLIIRIKLQSDNMNTYDESNKIVNTTGSVSIFPVI